jgi:hypothetical protein
VSVTGFNQRRRELAAQQEAVVQTLDDMTYNELRALAKEKGINGYGSMKKEELLEILREGD